MKKFNNIKTAWDATKGCMGRAIVETEIIEDIR